MGWLTLLGFLFGVWGIYLAYQSNREPKPAYSIFSDEMIVSEHVDKHIYVYYDSIKVSNVRLLKIIIWNAGNFFLDKKDIADNNKIYIGSTRPVSILEVRQVKVSRPNLRIKTSIVASNKYNQHIECSLIGDEVLEAKDGVLLNIVYSSNFDTGWHVNARIKGVPNGFIKVEKSSSTFSDAIIGMLLISIYLLMLALLFRRAKRLGFVRYVNTMSLFDRWANVITIPMLTYVVCLEGGKAYGFFILDIIPINLKP